MAESVNSKHKHTTNASLMALLRGWRWPWILFTLLVFSTLIKLGLWQWQRADEKFQRLERMQALTSSQALNLSEIDYQQASEFLNDIPIALHGEFINEQTFLLDNQTDAGKTGYRVFIPFNDHNSDQTVLVNLGWVQGSVDRSVLPVIEAISGTVQLTGHIRVMQPPAFYRAQKLANSWPQRIQHIDPEHIAEQLKIKLAPVAIYLDPEVTIGYKKNWRPIVMPPQKHRGYAWQWFSLALAFLSLMIWAGYKNRGSNHDR